MANIFNDVFDGSDIEVSIATEYDTNAESWNYETVAYRRGTSVDIPENTRAVYDGLDLKGDKLTQVERTLDITQEFQGFDTGLKTFEEMDGLLVKVEIDPEEGDAPTDNVRYYTNWCTQALSLDEIPDVGEFNATLSGRFKEETDTEPDDSEDWVSTTS